MAQKLIHSSFADFSSKLVKFHQLPYGTELRLYRGDGRRVRSDFTVKRRAINTNTVRKLTDDQNVCDFLDASISLLSTNIQARGFEISLFGPDGKRINGNKHLRTVRNITPRVMASDKQRKAQEEAHIEYVKKIALAEIADAEYLVDDPSFTVCRGYLKALLDRYGVRAVKDGLGL